jgi:hypothetical protein
MGSSPSSQTMTRVNPSPAVDNSPVTLCQVIQGGWQNEISTLSVLAVLRRHKFEIKPFCSHSSVQYFCELREGISPWPRQTLDQAMKEALSAHPRNRSMFALSWKLG